MSKLVPIEKVFGCFDDFNRRLDAFMHAAMLDEAGSLRFGNDVSLYNQMLRGFLDGTSGAQMNSPSSPRKAFKSCVTNWVLKKKKSGKKCLNYSLPDVEQG